VNELPKVPSKTESVWMSNALRTVLTVSKERLLKEEARQASKREEGQEARLTSTPRAQGVEKIPSGVNSCRTQ